MKSAFAVFVLAALCASSTAAPLGSRVSQQKAFETIEDLAAVAGQSYEIPVDAGLNRPELTEPVLRASQPSGPRHPAFPIVAAAFSTGTALAFSTVFVVSRNSLRRRRRRVKRIHRTMAFI